MSTRFKSSTRRLALVLAVALAVLGVALAAHAAPTIGTRPANHDAASQSSAALTSLPVVAVSHPLATKYVYVTNTGKKYHKSGCRYLKKSKKKVKLSWAKSHGYTTCKVCKPPKK